ncbi:hypothetical protein SAMN05421805_12429 [Saccharopolyspora antimicrobica]|uniref:Uncharacterized protein n=1 Tax=Saccharopolyspora antimicrobica TaxID=455193 RepID=A0A1I5JUE2_9PSEU|nr:hypothetical protein [Saccharopolyspora antimicrobica]RKT86945.1 hypothetical protein ATL45_5328 [Saccharopolyspora antimicrobica]SFO76442.1 hypothetical protein SAMN05421805_12429 [Saccharopolyspora antimicrobica]
MDTAEIDAAYRNLLSIAESIAAPNERSLVDWTLSHIALSDRILAGTARDVLAGVPPVVDNRSAMDDATITALIASTSHDQRVDMVRRNAADLASAIRAIPARAAATPVLLRLVDREGRSLPEQCLPWSDLVELRATEHIPGHAARLATHSHRPS